MSQKNIVERLNQLHIEKVNSLMVKILWWGFILSIAQDWALYFMHQISPKLMAANFIVMSLLFAPSHIMFKHKSNPIKIGYYNVFLCMAYIFFVSWNYVMSPFNLAFISFNIIVAAIYLEKPGYIFVTAFSILEVVFFSVMIPEYHAVSDLSTEIISRLQVILFVGLFSYAVFKSSKLLLANLLNQELQALQVAHEIRNPLTTVKGYLQLVSKEKSDKGDLTTLVMHELDRVNLLVTDYLTLHKPPSFSKELMDLNQLVKSVFDVFKLKVQNDKLKLEANYDPSVPKIMVNANQFRQVLLNLLNNALYAASPEGKISVCTEAYKENCVKVTVQDNGPGIDEEDFVKVFAPFFTTKTDGTGLGLAVCKVIIEQHGGTLVLQNVPTGGIRAEISLPI